MEEKDEFYIGYSNKVGGRTKKLIRRYIIVVMLLVITVGFAFSFFQVPAPNSSFDFVSPTRISGIYHESPYPMLRVTLAENTFKDVLLLGFGKYGANPYLDRIKEEEGSLLYKRITIEGNLIYYNGKTLLQIEEGLKLEIESAAKLKFPEPVAIGEMILEGEVIDPKCYFGVMKPGYGKIHRSCAALCISGGMPPVLATRDQNNVETYFLVTDLKGNPINKDIIPYIGQPALLKGEVTELGNWYQLKIEISEIRLLHKKSEIY